MSDRHSPERLWQQAISALLPFFIDSPAADRTIARRNATASLAAYQAATPQELQLAAQIIANEWAMMACLQTATAITCESVDQMLLWQDAALRFNEVSLKERRALDRRRKDRERNPGAMTPEQIQWNEGAFQRIINLALDKWAAAKAVFAAHAPERLRVQAPPREAPRTVAPARQTPAPVVQKMTFVFAEPMTPAVLALLAQLNGSEVPVNSVQVN